MLSDVGFEKTVYDKGHHNIINGSLNLNKPLPSPYHRETWDYKSTDQVCIQHAILLVNWYDVVSNKTTDDKVASLNNILKYI